MRPRKVLEDLFADFRNGEVEVRAYHDADDIHLAPLAAGRMTLQVPRSREGETGILKIYSPYREHEVVTVNSCGRGHRHGLQVTMFPGGVSADDPVFPIIVRMLARITVDVPIVQRVRPAAAG